MKNIKKGVAIFAGFLLAGSSIVSAQSNIVTSDTIFIHKNINDNLMEIQLSENARDNGTSEVKKIARQMISDHSQMLADLRKVASKKKMKDVFADPGTGNNVAPPATPDTTTEANGTGISGSKVAAETGAASSTGTSSFSTANRATTGTAGTGNSAGGNGSTGRSNAGSGVGTSTAAGSTGGSMNGMPGMTNLSGNDFAKMWVPQMISMHQAKLAELQAASRQIKDPELLAVVNKAIPLVSAHLAMLQKVNYTGK